MIALAIALILLIGLLLFGLPRLFDDGNAKSNISSEGASPALTSSQPGETSSGVNANAGSSSATPAGQAAVDTSRAAAGGTPSGSTANITVQSPAAPVAPTAPSANTPAAVTPPTNGNNTPNEGTTTPNPSTGTTAGGGSLADVNLGILNGIGSGRSLLDVNATLGSAGIPQSTETSNGVTTSVYVFHNTLLGVDVAGTFANNKLVGSLRVL